jgi:C4-dicarboxylate-specific signal transduction histidine kinase
MPDGTVKFVHVVAHATNDKPGKVEFVGALMDVTARSLADEALRRAQMKLSQATRLMTMGELTASIAHEVNQPLAAVVANANAGLRWLDRETPDLTEVRDALRRIVRDGTRGSEVISRIRGLLKKEQAVRSRLNTNDIVRETLALVRVDLQGTKLETDLAGDLPEITGDRIQLQQVLLNLTVNAIDAMKPVKDRPRVLRIQTRREDGHTVLVAVQDSGVGLTPEQKEQLFEIFYTTKAEGLGMGLSICRSIIEGHGGRLWVESNGGPGATFKFTIPTENGATS